MREEDAGSCISVNDAVQHELDGVRVVSKE